MLMRKASSGRGGALLRVTAVMLGVMMVASACIVGGGQGGQGGGGTAADDVVEEGEGQQVGSYGREGDPIDLVVGYQPYYTESWTGVIMRDQKLWEKHLPEGSSVTWQIGLQGAVIVSQMIGNKQHIGYVGDMPGLVATSRRDQRDIRIVSVLGMSWDQCNVFLVQPDAPEFGSGEEATRWMDGKVVATPQGSCTDRFAQEAFRQEGVQPEQYLNQSIEVISSNLEIGRIDATAIWEPSASQFENKGLARRVSTGSTHNVQDGGFMVMQNELIEQRPDVVEAWMKAELEAQEFLTNPDNHMDVVRAAEQQTEGFTAKDLWDSLYKQRPVAKGGHPDNIRIISPFVVDDRAEKLIDKAWSFLHEINAIPQQKRLEGIVRDDIARKALEESGLEYPKVLKGLPESEFQGEG